MKKFAVLAVALLALVAIPGCQTNRSARKELRKEQRLTTNQIVKIHEAEKFPLLSDSGELRLQNYYYTAEADPNKIWYLTLIGLDGTPIASYTIRGPVTSTNDQVTNPTQIVRDHEIPLAEPNAIYQGDHGEEHVAVLTSGAVFKFVSNYIVSDQPSHITQKPKLTLNENAAISHTDLGVTDGGTRPPKK